jgi:DeoR/GlpR family transcriptional regulator of sugar metabolism
MKTDANTKVADRREGIAKLVNQRGYASIEFLAEKYRVSTQTIRRDILALSKNQLVTRHHGGAGSVSTLVNLSYDVRRISMLDEKRSLAEAVADMIRPSSSLFISGGSTMEIVAQELSRLSNLCVITNNIHAAVHLYSKREIELLMPCGRVRHHNGGLVGQAAIEFVSNFQAEYFVMGIGAISLEGLLLDYDYEEAMLMNRMMKNARDVILVTDGTKFGKRAIAQVGHLREVACLVTDRQPPDKLQALIATHNISLVIPTAMDRSTDPQT